MAGAVRSGDDPPSLDDMDRVILRTLQRQGRISNRCLAQRAGLSASACRARVRRLEGDGIIQGYTAVLRASLVEQAFQAWALVSLGRASPGDRRILIEMLRTSEIVLGVWEVAANFEVLAYVNARHLDAWLSLELELERQQPNVSVKLAPVLAIAKQMDSLMLVDAGDSK